MRETDDRLRFTPRTWTGVALALLAASVLCLGIAPLLMPESYSIVENAVSESAGQGVESAWVARLGFLFLGFGVLILTNMAGSRWGVWGRLSFRAYGVAMIGNAAFSHMPWEDVPYDAFEDFLHSVTAGVTGAAFVAGVLIVMLRRGPGHASARIFDLLAVLAALGISMLMFNFESIAGLVQRIMFAIAYLWFGLEAIRSSSIAVPASQEDVELVAAATG